MTTATVRKPEALELGLDPKPLFELGLREVRAYARALWTDHNLHDPGITTLELLCYALTDLCYRACYPVEDLLAVPGDNARSMAAQFFSARRALPNAPLTELDYRKLLLDVDGVRNAWIYPVTEPAYYADAIEGRLLHDNPGLPGIREVRLRGLHGVRIEYVDRASAADKARIGAEVTQALHDNRGLCEDFVEVTPVQPQDFVLCAEIELQADADALEAHATILLVVQQYLAPGVRRYTRDEIRRSDPELFDGPAPRRGFIDAAELAAAELRSTIRLSDVISEVMDVRGVKAVRDIVIRPADMPQGRPAESKWEVSVAPGRRARLDPGASRLVLYKGSMPLPRSATAVHRFEELKQEDEKKYAPRPSGDAAPILGRFRDAGAYETVQTHFPALYAIGDAALPAGASLERQAQARQLQGWLLFFDQLMANDCAQLASLARLFSLDPNLDHSYFSQAVDDLRHLYPPPDAAAQAAEAGDSEDARNVWRLRIQVMLDALAEDRPAMLRRRNRFLDHLMARFAERLQDYLEIQAALFGATPAAAARAKCAFLGQYPELGAERGLGYDYTGDASADNVSGLEKRLAHLLGLGSLTYDIYDERDTDGVDEYRFRVRRRFTDGVLLSSTQHWPTVEEAFAQMNAALAAAQGPAGYQRTQTTEGEHYFNLLDAAGEMVARRIQYFATAAERDAAIEELIALVAEHRSERLCVIENILLRPRPDTKVDAFLPICAEPDCGGAGGAGCAGDDPYSYRLHIVLPAAAGRFRNMDFRRFAEDVIRRETPAHLLPKICWVGEADMTRVDKAWAAWRALLAGTDTTGRAQKFAELRDALYQAKNVYPAPILADCEAPEKFILGRSALGSLNGDNP